MDNASWFSRLLGAINREYERRIRAASQVTEYGVGHGHGDEHPAAAEHAGGHEPAEDDDAEVAEIVNVPRGTRLGAPQRTTSDQDTHH